MPPVFGASGEPGGWMTVKDEGWRGGMGVRGGRVMSRPGQKASSVPEEGRREECMCSKA